MIVIEVLLMISLITAGVLCSISDFKTSLIPNRLLLIFLGIGILLSSIYYGVFARSLFISFSWNIGIVALVSILLFYTKSFAGGDTKMCIVFAFMFPARFLFTYNGNNKTLIFAVFFAILIGYIYLAVLGLVSLLNKEVVIQKENILKHLKGFALLYLTTLPYITILVIVIQIISEMWISINPFVVYSLCFALALLIGKTSFFKKLYSLIPALIILIALSIYRKTLPISLDWKSYILVFVTLLIQMTVSGITYQTINTEEIAKGMVLSTISSLMMQNSNIPGLPSISKESLGDRLTEDEAEKVRLWGKSFGQNTEVTIVRKIPFAIFIALGYIAYFVIWVLLI